MIIRSKLRPKELNIFNELFGGRLREIAPKLPKEEIEEELKKEQERLENRPEIVKKLDSFFTKIKNHKWTKLDFIKIGCCIAVIILSYYILNSTFGFGNRKFFLL